MVQDFAGPTVGVPSFARPSFAWRSLPAWEKAGAVHLQPPGAAIHGMVKEPEKS